MRRSNIRHKNGCKVRCFAFSPTFALKFYYSVQVVTSLRTCNFVTCNFKIQLVSDVCSCFTVSVLKALICPTKFVCPKASTIVSAKPPH